MLRLNILLAALLVGVALPTRAQIPAVAIGQPISIGELSTGAIPAEVLEALQNAQGMLQDGEASPVAGTGANAREQRLKQLDYDRRPSTILKTWATPPKPPGEKIAEEKKPEEAPTAEEPPKTPEEALAREKAKEKAEKDKAEAEKKAAEAKALELEVTTLQRNVTLGDWAAVKAYFATLKPEEAKAGYERMLTALRAGPKPPQPEPGKPQPQGPPEKNRLNTLDIFGLAAIPAFEPDTKHQTLLGQLLRTALDDGVQLDAFLNSARPRLEDPASGLDRRRLARILVAANEIPGAGEFLPEADEASSKNDREALNLLAEVFLAHHAKDQKSSWLEKAWDVTQAALAAGEVSEEAKEIALRRAVDLAPKLKAELGEAWLSDSFTARPERGMEVLATMGAASSAGAYTDATDPDRRLKSLELQATAAKALLKAAPDRAQEWRRTLELLALNWLKEAALSFRHDRSTSFGPQMRRDIYGNFFFIGEDGEMNDESELQQQQRLVGISATKILDARPDDTWLAFVEPETRPKFDVMMAQLFLKVSEPEKAFPHIERLAQPHPKQAKALCDEFLRVWTRKNDPNNRRNVQSSYIYFYGFEERQSGIPLTRSKQERSLKDLGAHVQKLRALNLALDEKLLTKAFTTAHGAAEVFRLEVAEDVFGPIQNLTPSTLAELIRGMRANLRAVWSNPAVQERNKTKRKDSEIQAEVIRGFDLAEATVSDALSVHPQSFELAVEIAALQHDRNNYIHQTKKDPNFSTKRAKALADFESAAALYLQAAPGLEESKESLVVFDTWFSAALGATDLRGLKHEQQLAALEIPKIKAALEALPPESRDRHVAKFANALFTNMSSVAPACKFRYVREGLAIVGDHPRAREAKDVYDYYKDLITEIKLDARIDGNDRVGHQSAFGVHIEIRHTREVQRESGGFGKYLQNQNAGNYSYNYGRPLEDYRDKFEEAVRSALTEHFDVLSVTFNAAEAKPRDTDQVGWTATPYVYLLVKAKGPEVDRLPSIRLDVDFMDTTGYAVLPIESPIVPIDCAAKLGDARPYSDLKITQTLDERRAKDGKLLLEVKVEARGLVPEFEDILDFQPGDFEITKNEDAGVSVSRFDDDMKNPAIRSERLFTLTLTAKSGEAAKTTFSFGTPKDAATPVEHFRHVDADLAAVGPKVELEARYGKASRAWMYWTGAALIAAIAGLFLLRRLRPVAAAAPQAFAPPSTVNPFTVLGYLRHIERNNGLTPDRKSALAAEITRLEGRYFGPETKAPEDLHAVLRAWAPRSTQS